MKKQAKKVKAVKRSSKSTAPETEMPDLIAVMMKLTERLEAVEKKMDLVVSQTANRQQESRPHFQNQPRPQFSQPGHSQPQHRNHPPQNFQQQQQQHHHHEQTQRPHSEPNFNRAPQFPQNQNQNRQSAKPMYQAVCAECKKPCEVPFRPTGERPTYCRECFAARKSGGGGNAPKPNVPPGFPAMEKRQLKVVSNGVGKTVISEMVPAAPRPTGASKKTSKPAKKAKR